MIVALSLNGTPVQILADGDPRMPPGSKYVVLPMLILCTSTGWKELQTALERENVFAAKQPLDLLPTNYSVDRNAD